VVAVTARTLPVSTAVLVLDARDGLHSHVWKTDDVEARRADSALERARDSYAWFTGRVIGGEGETAPTSRGGLPPLADAGSVPVGTGDNRFLQVPLLVDRGRVFGVLQVEGPHALDEADVFFVNAAANQLAVAIDRQATIDLAEARVRAQLDFTRTLTGSLGEGVVATDVHARITFVNPAAEELLGYSEASVLGTLAPDVLRVQGVDGAMLEHAEWPLLRALETQTRVVCDDHSFVGRDGAPVPVSYTASPIRSDGRLSGAVMVFRDVLAVRRSERAQRLLADASAALGDSLDYATTLAALVRCTVPSFADVCAVDEVEEAGTSARVEDASHDPARPAVALDRSRIVVPLCVRGRAFGVLTFGMADSGRQFATDDLQLAQELGHRAATAIDNARLHRSMQDAVRDRQDILAIVSHDLRSPLNTISMAAATLVADADRPAIDRRRAAEMIARGAKRIERMTNDLLDMSSIEAGHLAIDAKPTAVGKIVDDIMEAMGRQAATSSIELVASAGDPLLLVRCDHDRILQALSNLVSNAIKFTPAGGRIELSVEATEGFVRFAVSDTGSGIAAELVPRLFERYRQAAETSSMGRGLGLFITKGIVEAHGGGIDVESAPGRGTTVFFGLPRAVAPLAS
jgi:PAS domain S-box-containing protein